MKYLYFGLGNPGEDYEKTRHNAGRIVLENIVVEKIKTNNDVAVYVIDKKKSIKKTFIRNGNEISFMYPGVFMNATGGFVKQFREEGSMLVFIYDDIDLPFGEVKLSYNKSGGSHNGVLSIVKQLGTQKFITIRIGVSKKDHLGRAIRVSGKGKVQDFVMNNFNHDEIKELESLSINKVDKIMSLLEEKGLEKTLSVYKTDV